MKKLIVLCLLVFTSCGNKKEITQIAAISCGQCKFELDSENGCSLAVKIDDEAYFVDGFNIDDFGDAHDKHIGFCNVVRQAEITGVIEEGRFKASAIKLVDSKIK
jgi:hypothetical protein